MFINPMWDNEAERIGKMRCTPVGYALHSISDLIGLVALITLFVMPAFLVYRGVVGAFHVRLMWLLLIPFAIAFLGNLVYRFSWYLAMRRGFEYNYDSRTAKWVDKFGNPQSFRFNRKK